MAHDVFISYSSQDKATADAACATLEAKGVRCWIAPRDVLPGEDYAEALIQAITSSRLVVLVFSSNSNRSPQVKNEVERAASKGIAILPIRIEDVTPSASIEFFISRTHWLDALTPPLERHLEQLAQTAKLLLSRTGADVLPAGQRVTAAQPTGADRSRSSAMVDALKPWMRRPVAWIALGGAGVLVAAVSFVALSGGGDGERDRAAGSASPTSAVDATPSVVDLSTLAGASLEGDWDITETVTSEVNSSLEVGYVRDVTWTFTHDCPESSCGYTVSSSQATVTFPVTLKNGELSFGGAGGAGNCVMEGVTIVGAYANTFKTMTAIAAAAAVDGNVLATAFAGTFTVEGTSNDSRCPVVQERWDVRGVRKEQAAQGSPTKPATTPKLSAAGAPFAPGPADEFAMFASPECVAPGGRIEATWTAPDRTVSDVIALFPAAAKNSEYSQHEWAYVQSEGGRFIFPASDDPGSYEVRLVRSGNHLAVSAPVAVQKNCPRRSDTVVLDGYDMTASPECVGPGGRSEATWTAPDRTVSDIVALLPAAGRNDEYSQYDWEYVSTAGGSVFFPAPSTAGEYEFPLLRHGTHLAVSQPITVGAC